MKQSRSFKVALLSFSGSIRTLTTLLCFVFLSRILSKLDYATYRQTILAYTILIPILSLGLPNALNYFLPRSHDDQRSILSGSIVLLSFTGFLFFLSFFLGGNQFIAEKFSNPDLKQSLLVFSPYALLALPILPLTVCLITNNKVKLLTGFNIISNLLFFGLVIGLTYYYGTYLGPVIGMVSAAILIFIPAIYFMYKNASGRSYFPNKANILEQLKYSIPLSMATMFALISKKLDQIIVSVLSLPEEFATYANGAFEIPLIGIIIGSVISILLPEFTRLYKEKNYQKLTTLWHTSIVKSALIIYPVTIFLFIAAPKIIRILFTEKYMESQYPFRVYLLLLPIRITGFGSIFIAAGKNKLLLYRSIILLILNIVLSIILVIIWGPIGAAISTVLVIYFWVFPFHIYHIRKILIVRYRNILPFVKLGKIMLISILVGLFTFLLSPLKIYGDLFYLIITSLLYGLAVIFLFKKFGLINLNWNHLKKYS